MRLRLQTKAPLPQVKAWFSPHPDDVPTTIYELKHSICRNLPSLRSQQVSGNDVLLLLDDFELLDDSPLDVVRDGDLILVKGLHRTSDSQVALDTSSRVKKRKRALSIPNRHAQSPSTEPLPKRKKELVVKPLTDTESDESVSSSSSSSSTSSSSSSTSSSSTTSSSSSSSSSASSPRPSAKTSKAKLVQPTQHFVPPGYGKAQTHNRNLRRRLKKKHDKRILAQTPDLSSTPPKNSSASNMVPLGSRTNPTQAGTSVGIPTPDNFLTNVQGSELVPTTQIEADTERPANQSQGITTMNVDGGGIMMSTLRNKNKRKGFKQSMGVPLPRKIVFDEPVLSGSGSSLSQQMAQTLMAELPGPEVVSTRPRLIPPSEKQDRGELPPRMFVTSVDVEEGLWSNNQLKKRKKQKQKHQVEQDRESHDYRDMTMQEEDVQLDYSDEAVRNGLDWDRAEKGWDGFVTVTDIEELALGTMVGWKGLALNPHTLSPEVMLSVASVIRLPEPHAERQIVIIKQYSRPRGSSPSLSHRLVEPEEEEMVEEECTWDDIVTSQWKIIKL